MSGAAVPRIDVERLRQREPEELRRLLAALSTVGFCRIYNHSIGTQRMEELASCRRAFFAQPDATKRRLSIEQSAHFRGWSQLEGERTNGNIDFKEFFDVGWEWGRSLESRAAADKSSAPYEQLQGPNQWPEETEALRSSNGRTWRATVSDYMRAAHALGVELLSAMAVSLGLPEREFADSVVDDPFALLRLNHYPPQPQSDPDAQLKSEPGELRVGIDGHCDYGCLTIVEQDPNSPSGLQVWLDQNWVTVQPEPGELIVNLGEFLQVWTSNCLVANVHRVVNRHWRNAPLLLRFFFGTGPCDSGSPTS